MKLLIIGDIFGEAGRKAVSLTLPSLMKEREIDFVVCNGENAAGGRGLTTKICDQLFDLGVDVITSGNHIWDQREIIPYISEHPRLLRPANYSSNQPGAGSVVVTAKNDVPVGVINLEGQIFMQQGENPFQKVDQEIAGMKGAAELILVDMHAEASSEKQAMGHYCAGRVTAVVGTHTHVPTTDARILDGGTATISDVGMTGPYDSIIGMDKQVALNRFLGHVPRKFRAAEGDPRFCAVLIEADESSGRATAIERIEIPVQ